MAELVSRLASLGNAAGRISPREMAGSSFRGQADNGNTALAAVVAPQVVPADGRLRESLRRRVRAWARRAGLVPPPDLGELRSLAQAAVRDLGGASEHANFVTVLLGNAIWEESLAAVSPERRLLLLPQCLRAPGRCEASMDEMGLACLGCGACPIAALEAEAEEMGTHVLVAEGTTVAMRLVGSGRVEAVVAVACLHSLERSFPAALAGGVPAMAIPLLDGGCRATSVDVSWVREILRLRRPERCLRPLPLERLRQHVKGWFEPQALAGLLVREGTTTEELACRAVAAGGKRWRPTLTAAVSQALSGGERVPSDVVRRVAVAVECFHKASLVHDDIEDGDRERNGQAALHVSHGTPIALNVGDLLIGEGYRLIAESGLASDVTARMLTTVARAQRALCLGQGEELAWTDRPRPLARHEALRLLGAKTAPAFEVGLVLGAMAAGADESTCSALRDLSASLGLAYQIRDDIDDNVGTGGATSPLLVALMCGRYGEAYVARWLGGELPAPERTRAIEAVVPEARDLFLHYRDESQRALRPIAHRALKSLLFRLVSLFLADQRTPSSDGATVSASAGPSGQESGR